MLRISTKNINKNFKNICINCKYFLKHWPDYPDGRQDNSNYGKCSLFGNLDLITGEAAYDYAKLVREDSSRCGTSGKLFESK
jgi:hypothetical protein